MRAKTVTENVHFERGQDPKDAMNIGGYPIQCPFCNDIHRYSKEDLLGNTNLSTSGGYTRLFTCPKCGEMYQASIKAASLEESVHFERGQDPKGAMKLGIFQKIMDNTKGAYSRDRYGDELWAEIIKWLLGGGYNENEIELILGSKFMRWGMDRMSENDNISLRAFDDYFSNEEDDIQEMIYDEFGTQDLEENVVAGGTGGVSAPMATLANTPGVGDVVPGAGSDGIGSGDRFDNDTSKKKKKKKKKRAKTVNEMNINPYDPVGVAMAKRLGAALPFKKGKGDKDVEQVRVDKDIDLDTDEKDVMTIEEWQKKFLGE